MSNQKTSCDHRQSLKNLLRDNIYYLNIFLKLIAVFLTQKDFFGNIKVVVSANNIAFHNRESTSFSPSRLKNRNLSLAQLTSSEKV